MNQALLLSAARTIGMIDTADLEQYATRLKRGQAMYDNMAPLFDPEYHKQKQSGEYQDAIHQLAILSALLEVRKAIDVRETFQKSLDLVIDAKGDLFPPFDQLPDLENK